MTVDRQPAPHTTMAPRRVVVELVDDDVVAILAAKSGAERLALAADSWHFARKIVESSIRAMHPEWDGARVEREVARRLSGGPT